MKSLIYLLFTLCTFVFTGCVKMQGTDISVWRELWVIPTIGGIASIVCWVIIFRATRVDLKEGWQNDANGVPRWTQFKEKVKWTDVAIWPWAVGLTILTILVLILIPVFQR